MQSHAEAPAVPRGAFAYLGLCRTHITVLGCDLQIEASLSNK